MSMTRAELQSLHVKLCEEARETQVRKNHDYATEADIFRNFRYFGGLGILVRMSDKLARLRSFEENGVFKVEDEKLADTIQDLINYAVIYYAYKHDGDPTQPATSSVSDFIDSALLTLPGSRVKGTAADKLTDDYRATWELGPLKGGPYCEDCDELAAWRSPLGTFWCADCKNDLEDQGVLTVDYTRMEKA